MDYNTIIICNINIPKMKIDYYPITEHVAEKIRKKARTRAKNMLDVTLIAKQHFQAYRKTMEHLTKRI